MVGAGAGGFPVGFDLTGYASQADVARHLGVSVRTVARLRAAGELPWVPGRPVRIAWLAVKAYAEKVERTGCESQRPAVPASALTHALRSTEAAYGKFAGQSSTLLRAVRAHAVTRAGQLTRT